MDNFALLASDAKFLLNIASCYAFQWLYSLNASKLLVFGETSFSHRVAWLFYKWWMGGLKIEKVDFFTYFGIVLPINESFSFHTAHIAYYAIQSVRPRLGSLHQCTSQVI